MKSSRDVAIDIIRDIIGHKFSKKLFEHMIADDSEAGRELAKNLAIVERHIEADRAAHAALHKPS